MPLLVLKLGGSILTDKKRPYSFNHKLVEQYARILQKLRSEGWSILLVLGGGSFGHFTVKVFNEFSSRGSELLAAVSHSMIELAHLVSDVLLSYGLDPVVYPPHAFCNPRGLTPNCRWDIVKSALELGVTPIVYGDVCVGEDGVVIVSGDELSIEAACRLGATLVAYATGVDGVYLQGKLVKSVEGATELRKLLMHADTGGGFDVTGGMRRKLMAILENMCSDLHIVIYNGLNAKNLIKALKGEVGTLIRL